MLLRAEAKSVWKRMRARVEPPTDGVLFTTSAVTLPAFAPSGKYSIPFNTSSEACSQFSTKVPCRLVTASPVIRNILSRQRGFFSLLLHWWRSKEKNPRWRDNMFRITGDAVTSLQGTFVENWLQASEEVLNGIEYFPDGANAGKVTALVVNSTPSVGGSTRARILFQTLLASARKSIQITTPYLM